MSQSTQPNAATPEQKTAAVESSGPASFARHHANWIFFAFAASLIAGVCYLKHGPRTAGAQQPASTGEACASDERFAAELAGMKNVDRAISGAEGIIDDFNLAPSRVQVPLMELNVNPFHQNGAEAAAIDSLEDVAAHDLRERERQAALQAVQSLRLQSIAPGPLKRACTINSVRYQEGQEAGGFIVEEIASNTVVVRKGEYRFELKPGT